VKSLGTGDYATATLRSTPYIAQFKTKLASARLGKQYHNNVKPRHFNGTDALSDSPEWFTPPIVFEAMAVEFDMDVASPGRDRVPWIPARGHLTRADDGLTAPWVGFVWLNPLMDCGTVCRSGLTDLLPMETGSLCCRATPTPVGSMTSCPKPTASYFHNPNCNSSTRPCRRKDGIARCRTFSGRWARPDGGHCAMPLPAGSEGYSNYDYR
jgi:hypothetical protein